MSATAAKDADSKKTKESDSQDAVEVAPKKASKSEKAPSTQGQPATTKETAAVLAGSVQVQRKDHRQVLLRPLISEKSYGLLDDGKYTFLVRTDANKTQIRIAVEKVFGVRVLNVNTMNRQGKRKRTRTGYGRRSDTKRAIVTLAEGDRIDIFGPPVS